MTLGTPGKKESLFSFSFVLCLNSTIRVSLPSTKSFLSFSFSSLSLFLSPNLLSLVLRNYTQHLSGATYPFERERERERETVVERGKKGSKERKGEKMKKKKRRRLLSKIEQPRRRKRNTGRESPLVHEIFLSLAAHVRAKRRRRRNRGSGRSREIVHTSAYTCTYVRMYVGEKETRFVLWYT